MTREAGSAVLGGGDAAQSATSFSVRLFLLREILQRRGLDCLLLVPGIDGRDNVPARQALNYLFMGSSGASPTPARGGALLGGAILG